MSRMYDMYVMYDLGCCSRAVGLCTQAHHAMMKGQKEW